MDNVIQLHPPRPKLPLIQARRGNLDENELEVFGEVLLALDEAERLPKVRAALVDCLGYDPCS